MYGGGGSERESLSLVGMDGYGWGMVMGTDMGMGA